MFSLPDFKSTDVDSRQVSSTSAGIDNYINELVSINRILENNIAAGVDPYWQGSAKDLFKLQLGVCIESLNELVNGYREINEQLINAGKSYESADDSVLQLIARLPK